MNTRAFLGACAALSLAAACPTVADAAVQVSQSGWQWGNPTPQGNTIRAMDFIAGRGYAIGDDGTALRTDDGGATWTGLATGTSQDLTRLQAVTPDVLVVLGGDGCVVRRSDDGGKTFRKMFVLAETNCPDKVAASYFVSPEVGYLLLRDGNVLRTTDGGQTFGRGTAIPGTPASSGGGQGIPADAIFTTPDAGIVFLAGGNTAFRTTDAGASWTPVAGVDPGNVQRLRAGQRDDLLRLRPGHAAALRRRRPDLAAAPRQRRQHDHRHRLRDARRLPALHRPRRQAAAHRGRRRHRRRRSPPRPRRSTRPASPTRSARSPPAPAARRSSPTTAAPTTRRSAATSPARSSSACGSGRRRTSRSRSAPAASSPARSTTA